MRKQIFGRRLKRDTNERKALFRSLMTGLILHGKIRTTEAKAKSIKSSVEKLVTIGKTKGDDAKRQLMKSLASEKASDKIIAEIAPKFENRTGGYTRILKIGNRKKDGASLVLMSWTETILPTPIKEPKRKVSKVPAASKVSKESKEKKETAKESKEIKKVTSPKK
jgi:large subunit ribosomal protein L17